MRHIQAPNPIPNDFGEIKIFLGGSIEMGKAEPWQNKIVEDLAEFDVCLLNPRRDDWDSTITQRKSDPKFSQQVNWELNALDLSDIIVFYFDPKTQSPITLLELGLYADSAILTGQEVLVCCPDDFWRKGNVEIVCDKYKLSLTNSYDELLSDILQSII